MKKVLRLVVFMFAFFAGMGMVMAQGPKSDGYIKVVTYTQDSETTAYLYSKTEIIQTINGISYDEESNILTLNNYNAERVSIQIHNMGDFKINVIGSNVINSYDENIFKSEEVVAILVTGNNSTTVYGGGSISFRSYIGIKSDTGILNLENVSLSNKGDVSGSLIVSEGKVNIESSTLSFDFYDWDNSGGIVSNDDLTIQNSNISGIAGSGIGIPMEEKGNISIINSTIDITITNYMKNGIQTENNLNIENSTIKTRDGSIVGYVTTNISNSNIDIKIEDGYTNYTPGIRGLNLNINDSNLSVDTTGTSCVMGKDIIINGGTTKLKSSDIGIRISNYYGDDNPISNLNIKKGSVDIIAPLGIGFDEHYDEGTIANFTMEKGRLVIKSAMGLFVSNANFKGGYVEIDTSNKDGMFDDNLTYETVFAMESINIASNIEVSNNAKVYKLDYGDGTYIYYLNDEEIKLNEQSPDSISLLTNVIIKEKDYKEEEITTPTEVEEKNDVVKNPKTSDIKVTVIILAILGLISVIFVGYKRLREIK